MSRRDFDLAVRILKTAQSPRFESSENEYLIVKLHIRAGAPITDIIAVAQAPGVESTADTLSTAKVSKNGKFTDFELSVKTASLKDFCTHVRNNVSGINSMRLTTGNHGVDTKFIAAAKQVFEHLHLTHF